MFAVSESMAAFLTAENLAQQSVSDSHIEDAMETAKQNQRVYNSSKPQHKGKNIALYAIYMPSHQAIFHFIFLYSHNFRLSSQNIATGIL